MPGPVLFEPRADLFLRIGLLAAIIAAGLIVWTVYGVMFSSYGTGAGEFVSQPVPFSHAHHVSGLGMDCRYCHANAAETAQVGMPTTDTCMHCHAQLWTDAGLLAPVRESWRTGRPLHWQRVHKLPDFVFFDHSVHVSAGVGCATCHGRVDQMPLMTQVHSLYMRWCLDCHQHPDQYLRPPQSVYQMDGNSVHEGGEAELAALAADNARGGAALTDCTACHR